MLIPLTERLNCKPQLDDLSAYGAACEIFKHTDTYPLTVDISKDLMKLKPFLLNGYQALMLDRFIFSYDRLLTEE